jgi:hypothetical protein
MSLRNSHGGKPPSISQCCRWTSVLPSPTNTPAAPARTVTWSRTTAVHPSIRSVRLPPNRTCTFSIRTCSQFTIFMVGGV